MEGELAPAPPPWGTETAEEWEAFIHEWRHWRRYMETQEKEDDTRLLALFVEIGQVATTVATRFDVSPV